MDRSTRHLVLDPNFRRQNAIATVAAAFQNSVKTTYFRIYMDVARTLPEFAQLTSQEDRRLVERVSQALYRYAKSSASE